jgi:hypothetical protein
MCIQYLHPPTPFPHILSPPTGGTNPPDWTCSVSCSPIL